MSSCQSFTSRIIPLFVACLFAASCGVRVADASSFGFLPGAAARDNTIALQSALDGGRCKVTVSIPGTYDLDGTIYLDDDTELECAEGVVLRKAAPYCNMFVNRGAEERTYNSGITLRGLNLSVNGNDNPPSEDSPLFGLRAQLAFLCTHGVEVYDFRCEDMAKMQYAIQFNQSDNFVLDTFVIRGDKDALHISSSDHFVLRNGKVRSFDDCIALNASDWNSSNCVDGDITDGLIEDIVDESLEPHSGLMCRMLVGAWVDWYEGISIRRGDMVVSNGKMYKAIAPVKDTTYFSLTEPVTGSYEGQQQDAGGFAWKLVRSDKVYYSTNIRNVTLRRITGLSSRTAFGQETYHSDSRWSRNFHPDVLGHCDRYPHIEGILVEDCSLPGNHFMFWRCMNAHVDMTFKGVRDFRGRFLINGAEYPGMKSEINFIGCDFTSCREDVDLEIKENVTVNVRECSFRDSLRARCSGKLVADVPVAYLEWPQ